MRYNMLKAAIAAVILLASCTAGKDYVRPDMPVPEAYKEANFWKTARPLDNVTKEAWWEIYNDSLLNELEKEVGISNQNLALKEAQFRQARALVDASVAQLFPIVTLGPSYARNRTSGNTSTASASGAAANSTTTSTQTTGATSSGKTGASSPSPTSGSSSGKSSGSSSGSSSGLGQTTVTNYSLPAALSWELDLWGSVRRSIEANTAGAEASFADLEALRLSVQAELAGDYFQLRTLDTQRQILDETIAGYARTLQITKNRYESGTAGKADVFNAETQLKSATAQAIDLGVQRTTLEHAIALLMGKAASSFSIPQATLSFAVPVIPAGVPSELLERRADISAAQRRVAAANAQIGVATAAYYPSVTIGASTGLQSGVFSKLFSLPSLVWSLGAALSQTIFDGGYKLAITRQARANYDAAVATYRQTVLTAFQEVEDALSTNEILLSELKAQDEAVNSAEAALAIAVNQYKAGTIGTIDLIVVQNVALNNKKTAAAVRGRIMANSASLIKALGGAWNADILERLNGPNESADKSSL